MLFKLVDFEADLALIGSRISVYYEQSRQHKWSSLFITYLHFHLSHERKVPREKIRIYFQTNLRCVYWHLILIVNVSATVIYFSSSRNNTVQSQTIKLAFFETFFQSLLASYYDQLIVTRFLRILYMCLNSCVSEAATKNCSSRYITFEIENDVLQNLCESVQLQEK